MAKSVYMQTPCGEVFETSNPESHSDSKRLTIKAGKALLKQQYIDQLKTWIKPGDTIYGNVNTVSSSGMSRNISFYIVKDGRISCIDYLVATAIGHKQGKHGGVVFGGCGMDMIFAGVYALGSVMWPNGTPEPHSTRNGVPDSCGGYALKHSQL